MGWTKDDNDEKMTVFIPGMDEEDEQVTVRFDEYLGEEQRTVGIYDNPGITEAVTGWIVCVEGSQRGASFSIHDGRNYVGRALHMDICIQGDPAVCRNNHFSIVYDRRGNRFYLLPGEGRTFLEGELVIREQGLEENMKIAAGTGVYIFVPFCKGERMWV